MLRAVLPTLRPFAVSVAALVQRQDMEAGDKRGRDKIPPMRMRGTAVHEQHRRFPFAAIVEAVENQSVGLEASLLHRIPQNIVSHPLVRRAPHNQWPHVSGFATRPVHGTIERRHLMRPFPTMRSVFGFRQFMILAILALALASPVSARAQDSSSNQAKARSLVDAAIKMTNSDEAVKLLWQATDIDPTLEDSYVYLGLYYNSRSDFANVVKVYQKLVKYNPSQTSAYLNIGEAYMSFSPPRAGDALVYYRKAYEVDPKNTFAALRIGQILAQNGNHDDAVKYLRQALADTTNPSVSSQAEKTLHDMNAL
jgi:tetratricopeptide (TPR) repeat protein